MTAISVIIPLFNKGSYIEQTILAFRTQLSPSDELLIVDDVSTDDSLARAQALESSQIRVLESPRNAGPADARNAGASVARGSHLLFFDADDIPHPSLLPVLRQVVAAHPKEKIFCFDLAFEAHGESVFWSRIESGQPVPAISVQARDAFVESCLRGKPLCTASSTCVAADAFRASGGFQSGLRYCEDPELWARLSANHCLVHIKLQLAVYRDVPQSLSYNFRMQPGTVQPYVDTLMRLGETRGPAYRRLARSLIVKNTFFSISMGGDRRAVLAYLRRTDDLLPIHWAWLLRFVAALPRTLVQALFAARAYLRKRKIQQTRNTEATP